MKLTNKNLFKKLIAISLNLPFDFFHIQLKPYFLLRSFPDFDDQIFALALELKKMGLEYYVVSRKKEIPDHWIGLLDNENLINDRSIKFLYFSKVATYILFTHGIYLAEVPRKGQLVTNLWHGYPIKKIGKSIGTSFPTSHVLNVHPKLSIIPFVNAFGSKQKPILFKTLSPRIDLFKRNRDSLDSKYQDSYIWMPTYRKALMNDFRTDGDPDETGLGLSFLDLTELDAELSKHNLQIIIKSHPMTTINLPDNLKVIRMLSISEASESIYTLLPKFKGLISDYSSVIVDFMELDKPIIIFAPDFVDYSNTRGLNVQFDELGLFVCRTVEEFKNQIIKNMVIHPLKGEDKEFELENTETYSRQLLSFIIRKHNFDFPKLKE